MNREPLPASCAERLEILTFRLGGVPMAAHVEQVLEMLDPDHPSTPDPSSRSKMPKLLVLRGQGETRIVEIDQPGDIFTVPFDSIQPMPALVAACAGARAYWGAVILDGSPVLLVDLDELVWFHHTHGSLTLHAPLAAPAKEDARGSLLRAPRPARR